LVLFAVLLLIAAGVWFMHSRIAVTITPSLSHTVFYLDNVTQGRIRRGDYVLFPLAHPVTQELRFTRTIKEVACVGGQSLVVSGREYYCDGTFLGTAKAYSLKGEKVGNFAFSGVIPKGFLFVLGHHKDSFDSRYFGLIREEDVEKIARPLL
jgi:conjugative transfer signal peptidase TraF